MQGAQPRAPALSLYDILQRRLLKASQHGQFIQANVSFMAQLSYAHGNHVGICHAPTPLALLLYIPSIAKLTATPYSIMAIYGNFEKLSLVS